MAIVEHQPHRIVAHRLDSRDGDVLLYRSAAVSWPGPWPLTSALGECTRRYSNAVFENSLAVIEADDSESSILSSGGFLLGLAFLSGSSSVHGIFLR